MTDSLMKPNVGAVVIQNRDMLKAVSSSKQRKLDINIRNEARITFLLKRGIWLYFVLLIFEGALRKWVFPSLSTPLLVVRDPIAFWLIITALQNQRLPLNPYVVGLVTIGIIGLITAVFLGHGNLFVALFGARILLHFPLIFVIGNVFTIKDVVEIGKVTLYMVVPMTVLIALQFYSPQSAWINLGVAGNTAGAGFNGAMGYFRPPAVFSFTTGTTLFYDFAACYVFYFLLDSQRINRFALIGATIGLIAAIPLTISRSVFFQVIVTMLFAVIAVSRKPQYAKKMITGSIGFGIALLLLSQASFFQTATAAFTSRIDSANESAGGGLKESIVDRFLDGMVSSLERADDTSLFGAGIGMGTNVGSQLLTGEVTFLISEGEWGRIIGELGALMGLMVIFLRIVLTIQLSVASYRQLVIGNLLPWMLLSCGIIMVSQGGWGQPTSLGFSALFGGLLLASLKNKDGDTRE